jgi:hypothetical protein
MEFYTGNAEISVTSGTDGLSQRRPFNVKFRYEEHVT